MDDGKSPATRPFLEKRLQQESGHGGIDYFVRNPFIEPIKRGVQTPIDVYDAAAWSITSPLSEQSVAQGRHPVELPDFTNGQWMTNDQIFQPERMSFNVVRSASSQERGSKQRFEIQR